MIYYVSASPHAAMLNADASNPYGYPTYSYEYLNPDFNTVPNDFTNTEEIYASTYPN